MAVMLQPPRPIIRDTTEAGTDSFFDLLTTSFQPSSLFWPLFGLVRLSLLGAVTGRAMVLNGEGRELEEESLLSGAFCVGFEIETVTLLSTLMSAGG